MSLNSGTPATNGQWADSDQRRAAARDAYRRSIEAGTRMTAAALAADFERSVRWAQERIAEVRKERSATNDGRSDSDGHRGTATGSPDERSTTAAERSADGEERSTDPAECSASDNRRSTDDSVRSTATGQRSLMYGDRSANERHGRGHGGSAAQPVPSSNAARRLDTLIVAAVALVAAAASYEHQHNLAILAGEGDLAYVLPISVDGMMLATSRSILRRRRAGRPVPFLSWFGFALGFFASVAANVAAADATLIGRLVAAWPPVALFIAYETLAADHGEFSQP